MVLQDLQNFATIFVTRTNCPKVHLDYSSSLEIMGVGLGTHSFKSPCDKQLRHAVMTSSFELKTLAKYIKLPTRSLCQFYVKFLSSFCCFFSY